MAKMTDDALLRLLQSREDAAAEYGEAVSRQRETSLREYYREAYPGDSELEGWSRIVTSEVQDTVEWMLPELLDVFTGTDEAVVFEPTTAEDVQGAEQATDTVNYVFHKQNNGFLVLYTAFKDALMVQNCAVMWAKEKRTSREVQELKAAPAEVLALAESEGYEIEQATPIMGAAIPLFDAKLSRKKDRNAIRVEAFPPEQLLIDREWNSPLLEECPYVCRVMQVTLSDLRQMGFKVTADELRTSLYAESMDESYRESRIDGDHKDDDDSEDESLAKGYLRIEFVLVDQDGDGIAERRVIYRLADKILSNEETDHVQIATGSPILNTHRWDGMSLAEIVSDIQRLMTDLTRNTINAANLAVNPRKTVLTDMQGAPYVNMDDLLDFRVGGIVRQTRPDSLGIEPSPFNGQHMLPLLTYVESMAEKRTGNSKSGMGLDPNSLQPDRTATDAAQMRAAVKARTRLIARIFAEVLVKPVFIGIFRLLTSGDMEPLAMRLRGQFVKFDPNEWRDQYDTTINVGLGTGDKAQQIGQFQHLLGMQMQLAQTPFGQLMIQPQNIYHTISKMVALMGQKDVDNYIVNPQGQPLPPPPPPPQLQLEQAKLQQQGQIEQAKMQMQGQAKQIEMQFKAQAAEMDRRQQAELELIRQRAQQETDASRQAMEAQMHQMKLTQEAELQALRAQYEDQRHMREMSFQQWKAELDAATKVKTADIASATNEQDSATQAATDEIGREVRP